MEAEADLKGSKMKDMGDGTFWLQYKADGGEVSKLRTQILKGSYALCTLASSLTRQMFQPHRPIIRSPPPQDASKKAQFPGFRKGQIPPYAMPQMTSFALQEAITNSVRSWDSMDNNDFNSSKEKTVGLVTYTLYTALFARHRFARTPPSAGGCGGGVWFEDAEWERGEY